LGAIWNWGQGPCPEYLKGVLRRNKGVGYIKPGRTFGGNGYLLNF